MRPNRVVQNITDAFQLLCLDWMTPQRRAYWHTARWELRTLKFRAHASLPSQSLANTVQRLAGQRPIEEVILPSPVTNNGGVGSTQYYYAIGAICRAMRPLRVVEIGTYLGISTLTIAVNTPTEATVHTVDLPDNIESTPLLDDSDRSLVERSRGRVGDAFVNHSCANKIVQLRADSSTLDFRNAFEEADLIVIDGGHSFEIVKHDSESAFSILKPGGVILWDDYWWFYPDVVNYLDRLGSKGLFRIEDTNLVAYVQE